VTLVPTQYTFEQRIRWLQKTTGSDPTREDNYRLQGVQMIDNVRRALQL
jgi:CTD kinase subunit beta